MKLGIFTRYDKMGASSRLRYYDYIDYYKAIGFNVKVFPFFTSRYLKGLYNYGRKSNFLAIISFLKRLLDSFFMPKRLIIEYELFPQLPYSIEKYFLKNKKYVLNFDDNVWEKYVDNPRLSNKYDDLIKNAAGIIVANDYLNEKVLKLNQNILKVPTVVDLERYKKHSKKRKKLTLVWIGTPITYKYLEVFAESLQEMAKVVDFDLLVIAKENLKSRIIPGVSMIFVDWSEEKEVELISSGHIGIMPLTDDEFSRGKSAYKLIQCLAAGLPVIASPVGENNNVVSSECGFLANSPKEWSDALIEINKNYDQYVTGTVSKAAEFSLQKYGPLSSQFIKEILQ